jgi:hypothetical protein
VFSLCGRPTQLPCGIRSFAAGLRNQQWPLDTRLPFVSSGGVRICEEKSGEIDRVVNAAEVYQLPAPDFRAGHDRTSAIILGPKPFDEMDRSDRIRACNPLGQCRYDSDH